MTAKAQASHVIATRDVNRAAKISLRGHIVMPGQRKGRYCASHEYDPERVLAAGPVRVHQPSPYEGTKKVDWRGLKKLPQMKLIEPVGPWDLWILRRSVVQPILGALPADEVQLHPAELVDDAGTIDDDWVLLDIRATYPIDRDASTVEYEVPENPHASPVEDLEELRWGRGREPSFAITRVGEFPHITLVRRDLFVRLAKALGQAIVPAEAPYSSDDWRPIADVDTITTWQSDPCCEKQPMPSAKAAARAADAFWRLRAGKSAARADVLASPHYAYWLARLVDRAPSDDTRAAACAQPFYAWIYARDIDRRVTKETQKAARRNFAVATFFTRTFGKRSA